MSRITPILVIVLSILVALVLRVAIPFHLTFTDHGIQFNTADAYYMLRYADAYPNIIQYDYFMGYPDGEAANPTVFPKILGFLAWLFGISVSTLGAILPPYLFLLSILPVYVITQTLFKDKLTALIAVAIYCLLPGDILHRTSLGAADYHCWEVFLLSYIMMFVVLAVAHYKRWIWLCGSIFGGLAFIYVYYLSWSGWTLSLLIIGLFLVIRGFMWFKSVGRIMFGYALVMVALFVLIIFTKQAISYAHVFVNMFTILPQQVISEEYPLFFTAGWLDMSTIWNYFGVTFYLFLIGMGCLLYRAVKYRQRLEMLLLVWTVVMLALTVARRRFDYYLAMNVAIITGYVVMLIVKSMRDRKAMFNRLVVALAIVIVVPLVGAGVLQASSKQNYMPEGWQECCSWLRSQIPNEEESPIWSNVIWGDYYTGEDPGYGVFTWKDYGYWIFREGHTPVVAGPSAGNWELTAELLVSKDIAQVRDKLKAVQIRYVIVDEDMVTKLLYPIYNPRPRLPANKDVTMDDVKQSFMYRLYYGTPEMGKFTFYWSESSSDKTKEIPYIVRYNALKGFTKVFESSDGLVKVWEAE